MCQLEWVFHRPCAHWSPRPRFIGEPCVRARRVCVYLAPPSPPIADAPTAYAPSSRLLRPTLTTTSSAFVSDTPATTPCDYPDHLGAVTVERECGECARRRDDAEASSACQEQEEPMVEGGPVGGGGGGGADADTATKGSVTRSTASSSSPSSSSSGLWRPFAGLSDGAWRELKRARSRSVSRRIRKRSSSVTDFGEGGAVREVVEERPALAEEDDNDEGENENEGPVGRVVEVHWGKYSDYSLDPGWIPC